MLLMKISAIIIEIVAFVAPYDAITTTDIVPFRSWKPGVSYDA